jgi:hypothetical protein
MQREAYMATTIKRVKKAACCPAAAEDQAKVRDRRTPVLVRFWPDMLDEIDAEARHHGISRSAWVAMAARAALDAKRKGS